MSRRRYEQQVTDQEKMSTVTTSYRNLRGADNKRYMAPSQDS